MRTRVALAVATLVVASGCTSNDEPTTAARRSPTLQPRETLPSPTGTSRPRDGRACSSDVRGVIRQPAGLPSPVMMMRGEIITAATRCDYDGLERLAFMGGPRFNYSFGEPADTDEGDPSAFWKRQEARGEEPLLLMLRMLARSYGTTPSRDGTIYVWPGAAGEAPSDDDWLELERSFGREQVEEWRTPEASVYVGPRLGITATGDWIFYVSGD